MPGLVQLLDRLPPVELPASFSEQDSEMILQVLSNAKHQVRPYDGDFTAPWLLSNFEDAVWYTTNRGREELIDGQWKNAAVINWNVILPNGAYLTDSIYSKLLTANKKAAFLLRSGFVNHRIYTPSSWLNIVYKQLLLSRWLVVHEQRYQPENYAFLLFDQMALNLLFHQLAKGGWTEAIQMPQRFLMQWYQGAFKLPCPQPLLDNPFQLPLEVCVSLSNWLVTANYFTTLRGGLRSGWRYLDREKVALSIHEPAETVVQMGRKLSVFFRQFETDFSNSSLLLSVEQTTEKPHHKIMTRHQAGDERTAESSLTANAFAIATFLSTQRHLGELLPDPATLSIKTAQTKAASLTRLAGHTPFLPINVGLAYLNHAMRWLHLYGDAIVDYYLTAAEAVNIALQKPYKKWHRNIHVESAFSLIDESPFAITENGATKTVAEVLGIQSFLRLPKTFSFEAMRTQPSLQEVLKVLIGACIICISTLKPSRVSELTYLKRDCLVQGNDGYYLRFDLGKSNAGEAYQQKDKPIPVIAAKAIQLLQKLGQRLSGSLKGPKKR